MTYIYLDSSLSNPEDVLCLLLPSHLHILQHLCTFLACIHSQKSVKYKQDSTHSIVVRHISPFWITMRFSTAIFASAFAALVSAQANPFTRTSYTGITAGTPINITWTPTSSGTITLLLVTGTSATTLNPISTVAGKPSQVNSIHSHPPFPSSVSNPFSNKRPNSPQPALPTRAPSSGHQPPPW